MSENLDYQYDQVVNYISGYREFLRGISRRSISRFNPYTSPTKYFGLVAQFPKMWRQINPLSGKNLDFNREVVALCATKEETTTDYFRAATSEYPTDTLSDCLKARFQDLSFEKLKKLHDLRKAGLSRLNFKPIAGFVIAGATLILKSVPKKFVEAKLGFDYDDFEIGVLYLTVLLLAYVFLAFLLPLIKYNRANGTHQYVGDILEYTAIKGSTDEPWNDDIPGDTPGVV